MWQKIIKIERPDTQQTFDLTEDMSNKTLMVYLRQDYKSIQAIKDTDYKINGQYITITSQIMKAGDSILLFELYSKQRELLSYAEVLFKMAFAMHTPNPPERFQYLEAFSWGKHFADGNELTLSHEEEELAISLLHHVATYLLANQIDTYLQICLGGDRFKDKDKDIRDASCIARLIRNAFAHDPFMPQWEIRQSDCKDKVLSVSDIIEIDTHNLDGKAVDRHDFGGPLSLLRLSEYVKQKHLK